MNTGTVDSFLAEGCGRCERYQTPSCKVHRWVGALGLLRGRLLAAGLSEQLKWGFPCYTLDDKNVAMLVALKESFALQFFQGAALQDPAGELERAGPNSRVGRLLRFRSVEEAQARLAVVDHFVGEAMDLARAGVRSQPPAEPEPMPEELARRLAADPELVRAFEALTPGRRRSHVLHVSGAKQPATRERRVERCAPEILAGRGFQER